MRNLFRIVITGGWQSPFPSVANAGLPTTAFALPSLLGCSAIRASALTCVTGKRPTPSAKGQTAYRLIGQRVCVPYFGHPAQSAR